MRNNLKETIATDLGLGSPFVKGMVRTVKRCWHFSTDGNAVDIMFFDEKDYLVGMNRIYVVSRKYKVVILAFSLMDTHVHFILYGEFDECNRFVHEYVRRTSQYIASTRKDRNKLDKVPVNWQEIDTEEYLKTAICYVVKNAPAAGKPFVASDYPWSSGPLYFRGEGTWCSPGWTFSSVIDSKALPRETGEALSVISEGSTANYTIRHRRKEFHTKQSFETEVKMIGDLVFPGEYVDYLAVEQLFRTHRAYHYFFCKSKESEIESRGGYISQLSIPMQEMRQHKNEMCKELFGHESSNRLNTQQRLRLAKALRKKYNSSKKQIIRLCGLVYDEVKEIL